MVVCSVATSCASGHVQSTMNEFCYTVYNQRESFICLDLVVKNIKVYIKRYFKW
jgi:hypothetical protein